MPDEIDGAVVEEVEVPKTDGTEETEETVETVEETEETKEESKKEELEEEVELTARPSLADIKKKYPTLLKEFPYLQDAYYREGKYSELFPTIEEAQDAKENNEAFNEIQNKVLEGDFSVILNSTKEADPEAYDKLVGNILPHLYKADPDSYARVTGPFAENIVRQAFTEASNTNNEDLQNAALLMSRFLFGTEEVAKGSKTFTKALPAKLDNTLKDERARFDNERFTSALGDVTSDIKHNIESEVLTELKKDSTISEWAGKKIASEVFEELNRVLSMDQTHMSTMNSKWKSAKLNGFNRDSKQAITTAFLARAKSLIPSIREKVKLGAGFSSAKTTPNRRVELPKGGPSSSVNRPPDASKIDWSKTSDEDVFSGNVKLKN